MVTIPPSLFLLVATALVNIILFLSLVGFFFLSLEVSLFSIHLLLEVLEGLLANSLIYAEKKYFTNLDDF